MKIIIINENVFDSFVDDIMQDIDFDIHNCKANVGKLLGLNMYNYLDINYQENITTNSDHSECQHLSLSAYKIDDKYPFSLGEDGVVKVNYDGLLILLKKNKDLPRELLEVFIDKVYNSIDNFPFILMEIGI